MKLAIIIGAVLGAGAIAWPVALYTSSPSIDTDIYIAGDQTDSLLAQPRTGSIISYAHLDKHKMQGVRITASALTEYEYNEAYTITLQREFLLLSNPNARDHRIAEFTNQTDSIISLISTEIAPRKQSSLYVNIVRQLNQLAASSAVHKYYLLYSDAAENTEAFSIYRKDDYRLLQDNPDEIQKRFEKLVLPDDLTEIQVCFIFKPRSKTDEARFLLMSALLKKIFTEHGAEVTITANLNVAN